MFKYDTVTEDGILRVVQDGRSSYQDFQNVIPDVMESLKTRNFPNLLLEIKNLEHDEDYVDPDLAFWTLNKVKTLISKMAIVCPDQVREDIQPIETLMTNYNVPAKIFDN